MEEWLSLFVRIIVLFGAVLFLAPLAGRKSVSGMTYFDLIAVLVLAGMISMVALNVVDLRLGASAIVIWFLATFAIQYAIQKSKWAHDHFYGKEVVVIKAGKIMEENLHSAGLTGEELLSQLRRKNIFNLADVEFAIMEANRDITVMPKREKQPLTPYDCRIEVDSGKEPQTVILDGNILDEPLATRGLNRDWLRTQLEIIGVNLENVFLAQVDSMGELYVDCYDDALQLPQSSAKDLLMATLEKIEADFISYHLETKNPQWKENYNRFAKIVGEVIEKLEPHLKA
ncbi:DUF421 domain-containing protein [Alkaliphilus crotonatoxidans]